MHLHGGPGAGAAVTDRAYYRADKYRAILFDQRGAGRSKPFACVRDNNIDFLVADIEALRRHLGVERWIVSGGSWGSALAMFYALRYPARVSRLLLRGVMFATPSGSLAIVNENAGGAAQGKYWPQFSRWDYVREHSDGRSLFDVYYDALFDAGNNTAMEAATRFCIWNASVATYGINEKLVQAVARKGEGNLPLARLFFHFVRHVYRESNRDALLRGMAGLDIPVDIVHGREDMLCPVDNARALHEACKNSRLFIVPGAGHAPFYQPALYKQMTALLEEY
jgi:proline iminopeptidase